MITPAVKCLVRACAAAAIGAFDRVPANQVIAREWSDDANTQWLMRAATTPTSMASAPAMVRTVLPDFVAALAAESAAARIFQKSLQLSFGNAGRIPVPSLTGSSDYAAFVGEGDPIPVAQAFSGPAVLTPKKVASITVFTSEMIASSNIEALMQDALIRSAALALDKVLFDSQPETTVRPVGMRWGQAALTASSAPDAFDALVSDVETLNSAIETVSPLPPIFVTSPAKSLSAGLRTYRNLVNLFGSYALHGTDDVIAIAPNVLACAVGDLPAISAKRGMVAVHADNVPLPLVAGGVAATPAMSTWQVDCVALKMTWPVTWALRSPNGVAWLTTVNW